MGALFSRIKTWTSTEDVSYSDLNAEFDNILNYLVPLYIDDYSTNAAQMQVTTDPGEVGSESLATTLAGEIARLRFMIEEITGESQWYESPIASLAGLSNAVGTGLNENRLVSGLVISGSQQPGFLIANGAAKTVKCDGSPTPFIYYIDGIEYSISTDVTLTGLTAAPSSNNTCLIDDAIAAGQDWTKCMGENGTSIPVDNMGSEISALVGKFAAFKIGTEYFTAYVSSTTSLTKAKRGYFFDSSNAALPRVVYSNNDTITLLKLTWVFANTAGALTATYNNPIWSDDEPTSPSIGDYWFDYSANTWKVYGVGSYSAANAVLIGVCVQDTTNTIGARSFEFFANYTDLNTIELIADSNSQVKSRFPGSIISVWGEIFKNEHNLHTWDMTLDLDSGVTENASTTYYFYITETGDKVISNVRPHDRREDLRGYYHTHKSWRCIGWAFNNASSNLSDVESDFRRYPSDHLRSVIATDYPDSRDQFITLSGASHTSYLPSAALMRGRKLTYTHGGTSLTQLYTLDGFASETIGGATTFVFYTNGESLTIQSDGTNWIILNHHAETDWVDAGAITIGATTTPPDKGSATIVVDKMYWKRSGRNCKFMMQYRHSAAGTATNGTGDYLFTLPTNISLDTTILPVYTTAEGATAWVTSTAIGTSAAGDGTNTSSGIVSVYSATEVRLLLTGGTVQGSPSAGAYPLATATKFYMASFEGPISGWKP